MEKIAWLVCYVVSGIFAYPILGAMALIGTLVNWCVLPLKSGYSLWARLNGVPKRTEEFCSEIRRELLLRCKNQAKMDSLSSNSSTDRLYSYAKKQFLSFAIQNAPEEEAETEEQRLQLRLSCMESQISSIQEMVRELAQKYGWFPETLSIESMNQQMMVMIPIPDHIPLDDYFERSSRGEHSVRLRQETHRVPLSGGKFFSLLK